MDTFNTFSDIAQKLLPVFGVVVLLCVIILLIKLIKVLNSFDITVNKTNKTIDLVDESIDKIQAPLDTIVKVSNTVDKAHDATVSAVSTAKDFVVRTAVDAKNKVTEYLDEKKDNKEEIDNETNDEIVGDK